MSDDLVFRVVSALAAADGLEPEELDYSITSSIDPGILDRLSSMDRGVWEFTFDVSGHEVTVTHGGEVRVDGMIHGSENRHTVGELRDAEQSRTEEHRYYQTLLDDFPGILYYCRNEPRWPMEFVSRGCRDLTGYEPNVFVVGGVSYGNDVICPDDRESVWNSAQRALGNGEPFRVTYRIQTAQGGHKRVWKTGQGVREDGDVVGIVGCIVDVTDLGGENRPATGHRSGSARVDPSGNSLQ